MRAAVEESLRGGKSHGIQIGSFLLPCKRRAVKIRPHNNCRTMGSDNSSVQGTSLGSVQHLVEHFVCIGPLPELIGSLKLGNVWDLVQLIFGPRCPMNQLNKNSNIA